MSENDLVLHMFPASHYNEKVRWALDWEGLPHQRVSYLPGPHMPQIRLLSGQAQTPVLLTKGRTISGSARIIGDAFSVADLAVASLLAPLAGVAHADMVRPQPIPARAAEFYARYEKHAAIQWVREQYARHRPASCGVLA
jgi:glutathione S-transferase